MRIVNSQMSMQSTNVNIKQIKATNSVMSFSGSLRNGAGALFGGEDKLGSALGGMKANNLSSQPNNQPLKQISLRDIARMQKADRTKLNGNDDGRDYRIKLLERLVEMVTGKPFKLSNPEPQMSTDAAQQQKLSLEIAASRPISTRVQINSIEIYEMEGFTFEASGTIQTSDGRTIDMSVALNMSREFYSKIENINVTQNFVDPLVINFATDSAGLSDMKFSFDLDADGTSDQISKLKSGSGFLAFDINNDGVINDGSELFGAKSGNGFTDLAKYDSDSNGWIDENDEIFDKLRIWVKDDTGADSLFALGEKGIGAIYLGNLSTNFSLTNSSSQNGMLRRTGIFLNEDGTAGTIQHVDMSI